MGTGTSRACERSLNPLTTYSWNKWVRRNLNTHWRCQGWVSVSPSVETRVPLLEAKLVMREAVHVLGQGVYKTSLCLPLNSVMHRKLLYQRIILIFYKMLSLNDKAKTWESKPIWYKTKEYSYSCARVWSMKARTLQVSDITPLSAQYGSIGGTWGGLNPPKQPHGDQFQRNLLNLSYALPHTYGLQHVGLIWVGPRNLRFSHHTEFWEKLNGR